jgi:K+-transporting ATPase KdpF subunit
VAGGAGWAMDEGWPIRHPIWPFLRNIAEICSQLSSSQPGLSVSPSFSKPLIISKKSSVMMTVLFILSIAVFVYLLYVLIKPEKF